MPLIKIVPSLKKEKLALRLGQKRAGRMSYSSRQKIKKLNRRLEEILKPSLYFRSVPLHRVGKSYTELEDGTRFQSIKLSRTLKGCEEVVCFAATIGETVETEISRLIEQNNLSEAYILDTMGSILAENMAESFWQRMSSQYKREGRGVSIRFSPGYCDWSICEQEKLFRYIDTQKIPVTLTDSFLMSLRKSVSGVFGISHPHCAQDVSSYNPCDECRKVDCTEKRKRVA